MEATTRKQPDIREPWWCWQRVAAVPILAIAVLVGYLIYLLEW